MSRVGYNGYRNWETWNVALWFANDEPLYRSARAHIREFGRFNAARAKDFVKQALPKGTPDFKSPWEYNKVAWSEVSKSLNEMSE